MQEEQDRLVRPGPLTFQQRAHVFVVTEIVEWPTAGDGHRPVQAGEYNPPMVRPIGESALGKIRDAVNFDLRFFIAEGFGFDGVTFERIA